MTADPTTADAGLVRLRHSPLAHRAAELATLTTLTTLTARAGVSGRSGPISGVSLVELPFLAMVSLRVDPASTAAVRVERALGLTLPAAGQVARVVIGEVDGVVAGEVRSVLWLGPDEWLVVGPDGDTVDLVALLIEAIEDGAGSVVDVSANRTTLVLSGPRARDVLEKGCTLDLHPRAFGAGQCAQTTFARGQTLLWQTGDDDTMVGPVYRLLVRSSFADYFADWLLDAAAEFVVGVRG